MRLSVLRNQGTKNCLSWETTILVVILRLTGIWKQILNIVQSAALNGLLVVIFISNLQETFIDSSPFPKVFCLLTFFPRHGRSSWPFLLKLKLLYIVCSNSGRITLGCCNFWWNKLKSYHLTPPSILCALLNRCTIVPPWLMMLMLIKLKFT